MIVTEDILRQYEKQKREIEATTLPAHFGELIDRAAESFGDRIALRFFEDERELSFAALREDVCRLASSLHRLGVAEHSHVAVMLPNRIEFPVTWLALATLGAVMVPTNTLYTGSELDYLFNDAEVEYLVIDEDLLPSFESMGRRPADLIEERVIVCGDPNNPLRHRWDDLRESGDPAFVSGAELKGDTLLNIQYTSGTTGFPKGCMQSHRYWLVTGCCMALFNPEINSLLSDHPFFYMDPQWQLVWGLYGGATVNVARRMSSSRFLEWVRRYDIEWAWFPKPILNLPPLATDREHPIKKFHVGAISPAALLEGEERFGRKIRGAYGMTEIGGGLVIPDEIPDEEILGTCGLPAPYRQVRIVDSEGRDLPDGDVGELLVRGDGIFSGYFNKPEANKEAFIGPWFRTGDLFVRTEAGHYKIVGRIKDMIRRSSENISALEVEQAVMQLPGVFEAAAVAVPDEYRGEEVKVYVQLNEGFSLESLPPEAILEHCGRVLAAFKVPRFIAYVDTFPRTSSNKVAKNTLITDAGDLRADCFDSEKGP
jgi:acyl-CoA synthetase (AMP-forming)/AMP-acid ligase II